MAKRGLTMTMLSDPEQRIITDLFHIRNPAREELAIHAVYILDGDGRVFYRKVGRRRPLSPEFLAAIDWHAARGSLAGPDQSKVPKLPSSNR